jgi:hypothetical protein
VVTLSAAADYMMVARLCGCSFFLLNQHLICLPSNDTHDQTTTVVIILDKSPIVLHAFHDHGDIFAEFYQAEVIPVTFRERRTPTWIHCVGDHANLVVVSTNIHGEKPQYPELLTGSSPASKRTSVPIMVLVMAEDPEKVKWL